MSDPIKDSYQAIKDAVCGTGDPAAGGIKQIVGSTSGELSAQQKTDVENKLRTSANDGAQDRIEIIIDPAQSPSFDPTNLGENFTEYDATGKGTGAIATDLCQEACDALDAWCEDNQVQAARLMRRMETTIVALRASGGISE